MLYATTYIQEPNMIFSENSGPYFVNVFWKQNKYFGSTDVDLRFRLFYKHWRLLHVMAYLYYCWWISQIVTDLNTWH